MTQQMRFENNRFAFPGFKDHAMKQEAHAGRDGSTVQVAMSILKKIRSWSKAMCSSIRRCKRNHRERFSFAEMVMFLEHVPRFFNQSQGFLPKEVIAWCIGLLAFGDEAKQVADTRGAIFRSWWGIIDQTHEAIFRDPRLHEFIDAYYVEYDPLNLTSRSVVLVQEF